MTALIAAAAVAALDSKQFSLTVENLGDVAFAPSVASSGITIARDGDVTVTGVSADTPNAADWIEPRNATVGDDYEVRLTVNSGDNPTAGGNGTWVALNTDRTFSWTTSGDQTLTIDATLEIRRASNSLVVVSTTLSGLVTRSTV